MNYRSTAELCLQLFRESKRTRARGKRRYGAHTNPNDLSGFPNPNNSAAPSQGHRPGYGRSKVFPKPPMRSIA
jgi:hypothetical protein